MSQKAYNRSDGALLKLSHDRKVAPRGIYQASRDRWVPTIANSFGLPAGLSCPGKTPFCESCYAVSSERSKGVSDLVLHNARLLTEAGTVDAMHELLDDMIGRFLHEAYRRQLAPRDRVFRIHWDGDFFSLDYATAWARVIHDTPDVDFWAYTRSFIDPVNVVPILAGIPNLSLYLSADGWNIDAARAVSAEFRVPLAICAADYRTGREIAPERDAIVCPENAEKMPLMKDGRGACVDCRLCIRGDRDVLFSTSHQEDATVFMPRIRRSNAPVGMPEPAPTFCLNCDRELARKSGPGRPKLYCDAECRRAVYLGHAS